MNNSSDLLIASAKGSIVICKKSEKEMTIQQSFPDLFISSLLIHNQGKEIYIGTRNGGLIILDPLVLEIKKKFDISKSKISYLAHLSSNLVITTASGSLYKFDVHDLTKLQKFGKILNITAMASGDRGLAVASESNELFLYSDEFELYNSFKLSDRIKNIQWAGEHLAYTFGSEVRVMRLEDMSNIYSYNTYNSDISSLAVFENYLVTGSCNGLVKVWNLKQFSDEITLNGHLSQVTQIVVEDGVLHSLDSHGTIRVSRLPVFTHSAKFETIEKIVSVFYSKVMNSCLALDSTDKISCLKTGEVLFRTQLPARVICTSFTANGGILVVFQVKDPSSCHLLVNLVDLDQSTPGIRNNREVVLRAGDLPWACCCTVEKKYLITGEVCRITVWNVDSGLQEFIFCTHSSRVLFLLTVKDRGGEENLIAADEDGVLKTYNLDVLEETFSYCQKDSSPINQIHLHPTKPQAYLLNKDKSLQIINLDQLSEVFIKTLPSTPLKLLFHSSGSYFFLSFQDSIQIWSCESYTKLFSLFFMEQINDFSLDHNGKILIIFENHYLIIKNPFDCKLVTIYGKMDETYLFISYITQIFQGFKPKFSYKMNQFVIEPFNLNILHIYAYFGMADYITRALRKEIGFFPSRLGLDPIQIAIQTHNKDALKALLNNLLPVIQSSPTLFFYISKSMTQLNYLSPDALPVLYKLSFIKNMQNSVPRFCKEDAKLPIVCFSQNLLLSIDLESIKSEEGEGKAVDFYQSYLQINYSIGSSESIEFLKSLTETKQIEIFNCLYLKFLIDYKWRKVRWVHFLDCLLYFIYLFCLVFGAYSHNLHNLLIISFSINQLLLTYEIFQLLASPKLYFTSFTHYIDTLRGICFDTYCIIEYLNKFEEYHNSLFLLILFLSILRAFSYFRIFKATRWLIYLILNITFQLWSFILVTLYLILSFWVLNFTLQTSSNNLNIASDIKLNFMLFFFILIVNPLIIINLFINIIGNALEKINNEKAVKDLQELTELVLVAESLIFWRRSINRKFYFQVCATEQQTYASVNSLTEKIKRASENVQVIQGLYAENSEFIENLKESLEKCLQGIEERVKGISS